MAIATSLFKYRTFNKSSIESLINRTLWFAGPRTLNDPFECQLTYKNALEATWSKFKVSEESKKDIDNTLKKYLMEAGICSFSRTRKNQLMWSHYADEHKGFCIGFNQKTLVATSERFFTIEVDYQSELPYKKIIERLGRFEQFRGNSNVNDVVSDILYSIIGTKYSNWTYEKETRLVRHSHGPLAFTPKAINSIAFGLRMSERDKATLNALLSGGDWSHVKWYQAEKSKDRFALEFQQIKI